MAPGSTSALGALNLRAPGLRQRPGDHNELVMQIPPTAISIPWNRAVVEEWLPDDGGWGQVQRRGSNRALMGWRLFLLRPGAGGLSWACGPGSLGWRGPPGWPRMWQRRWSRANPSVVSPWGRGSSTRGMKGRSSRGGAHSNTTLSDSRDRHGGGGGRGGWNGDGGSRDRSWRSGGHGRAWIGAVGKGRGRVAYPRPEGVSPAGLHHGWAREREEVDRGTSK